VEGLGVFIVIFFVLVHPFGHGQSLVDGIDDVLIFGVQQRTEDLRCPVGPDKGRSLDSGKAQLFFGFLRRDECGNVRPRRIDFLSIINEKSRFSSFLRLCEFSMSRRVKSYRPSS